MTIKSLLSKVVVLACIVLGGCINESFDTAQGDTDMKGWGLTVPNLEMGSKLPPQQAFNATFDNRTPEQAQADQDSGTQASEANQYTVQITINQPPGGRSANGPPNLRAYINWVTSGVTNPRVVTVGDGTSVSGSGSGVSISLQDVSTSPVDPTQAEYEVTIIIVPGTRGSTSSPPILVPLPSELTVTGTASITTVGWYLPATGAGTIEVDVPEGAGVQSYYLILGLDTASDVPAKVVVTAQDVASSVLAQYNALGNNGFVPVIPQTNLITLTNEGAADAVGLRLIWGIDG